MSTHKALPGDTEKNCLPRLGGFSQIRSHIHTHTHTSAHTCVMSILSMCILILLINRTLAQQGKMIAFF